MHLVLSTKDFQLNGQSYAGFPLLVNKDGLVVQPVLRYCLQHLIKRGRVSSKKTWQKYGQDLYDFFSWIECNNIDWTDVGADRQSTILAEYRDWSLGPDVNNSQRTVNARLRVLISFYRYAYRKNWVSSLPYEMENVRVTQPKGFLAHVDSSGGIRASTDVMGKTTDTVIRVLTTGQPQELIRKISNETHRLMVRLALDTGLRREEIGTFPKKYIFNPETYTEFRSIIRVHLDPNEMTIKSNKGRAIDIPRVLMEDLWRYVVSIRYGLEQLSTNPSPTLFLNKKGDAFAADGAALLKIVKKAGIEAGIPHANVHILRHTYATHTLYKLMNKKGKRQTNALIYVRDRLGHSSVTTTEKYLHLLSEVEENLMDSYQDAVSNA